MTTDGRPDGSEHDEQEERAKGGGPGRAGTGDLAGAAEPGGTGQPGGARDPGELDELAPSASAERRRLENEFLDAIRRSGSIMQLLGQVSADRIGINATDLNCLNIVALTGAMTAGDLARATGLTTASITGVLDRLEEAGFVRRERDPNDRRRVIVNLNAGRGWHDVAPVFAPVIKAWRGAAAGYSDDELRLILDFQRQVADIMRDQLAQMREQAAEDKGAGR
jgi:DNA-binding MarR family transcriptional regulator